jgi:hypothetical protein
MNEMPGTENVKPESIVADPKDLERWLMQAFQAGWDVARYFPNDTKCPQLVTYWKATGPTGRELSPGITYVRPS